MTYKEKTLGLISAATLNNGIGHNGDLPWRLPLEMAYFNRVTKTVRSVHPEGALNAVIMGRRTWDSIPLKYRPFSGRINIVLSRNPAGIEVPEGVHVAQSIDAALARLDTLDQVVADLYVVGGGPVYAAALAHPRAQHVFLTRIHADIPCDTFFPTMDPALWVRKSHKDLEDHLGWEVREGMQEEKGISYEFSFWERVLGEEEKEERIVQEKE
ncbi:MAG: dihydrofolate reductase-like domain-containing protein [Piptocephalis tieghemiana]|nr:MAG: dihydrofolate reductase-like domain-containing protein [Piptocephalis tieghemiana]